MVVSIVDLVSDFTSGFLPAGLFDENRSILSAFSGIDWWMATIALLLGYVAYEQLWYLIKKGSLPGPRFVMPILGGLIPMVFNPVKFWEDQAKYGDVSWNSLAGKFFIFTRSTEMSNFVFKNNDPKTFQVVLHPNAKILLGNNNIAFMQGQRHRDLRHRLLPLFHKNALACYVATQDKIIREHMSQWVHQQQPFMIRDFVRDMNVHTSQSVFVGPYLREEERKDFHRDYLMMNSGFLALPLYVPGTTLWKAVQARKRVVNVLSKCAARSKDAMRNGGEPSCLMDFWMARTVREMQEAEETGGPAPPHSTDFEIGSTVLDFLFASQDASTASLVWTTALMADNPEILQKVREEQIRVRPNDEPVTADLLLQMPYTTQVMKEILRFRPAATMVPHVALEDVEMPDKYVVPKGSLVMPSCFESAFQGYPDAHKFDPDRMSPEREEDKHYNKYFLTFGTGSHRCIGAQYASNHIMTYLSLVTRGFEFTRVRTPKSDDIEYLPTIYPADGVIINLKARSQ